MLIEELEAKVLGLKKLVEQKNEDEGREKGEEGFGRSAGPAEFPSLHTELV